MSGSEALTNARTNNRIEHGHTISMSAVDLEVHPTGIELVANQREGVEDEGAKTMNGQAPRPQMVVNPMQNRNQRVAAYSYAPDEKDEIELIEGDVITDVQDEGNGWSRGRNFRTGLEGYFPTSWAE